MKTHVSREDERCFFLKSAEIRFGIVHLIKSGCLSSIGRSLITPYGIERATQSGRPSGYLCLPPT
jgi:hypothetical protein